MASIPSSVPSPSTPAIPATIPSPSTNLPPPPLRQPTLLQNILAGALAGIIGQSIIFPLYTAKTRLQSDPKNFRTVPGTLRKIFAVEGFRGLYKGLPAALTGVAPEKAIKLSANDYFRKKLSHDGGSGDDLALGRSVLAGGLAGFCQVIATCPMEMSMITLQTRAAAGLPKMGLVEVGRMLGVSGLYKGTVSTLTRDVPFSMVFFSMNASLKSWFKGDKKKLGIGEVFLAGTIAGSTAAAFSTPMDVVKTRLQASETVKSQPQVVKVEGGSGGGGAGGKLGTGSLIQYRGIPDCVSHIWKTEGWRGFMNGVVPRILIISPLFGIALLSYEVQQRLISKGSL